MVLQNDGILAHHNPEDCNLKLHHFAQSEKVIKALFS
jgi:hypothetical protein